MKYNPYIPISVRKVRKTTIKERINILEEHNNNIFMIPQDYIMFDYFTDSSRSTSSSVQLQKSIMTQNGPIGSGQHLIELQGTIFNIFGFKYSTIFNQGRSAEAAFNSVITKESKKDIVLANNLFSTMKYHQSINNIMLENVSCIEHLDFESDFMFKGNIDINKLTAALKGREIIYVAIELSSNDIGGYAVSLANLYEVKRLCENHNVKLVIDGTRIIENAYIIQQYEKDNLTIQEILKEICILADYLIMSMKKDFMCDYGGVIACNDYTKYLSFSDYSIAHGGEISGKDLSDINEGIYEAIEDSYVEYRDYLTSIMYRKFSEEKLPVISPKCSYAVFLDMSQICIEQNIELHDIQIEIYIKTGIRVGSNTINERKLIRIAIPHRLYDLTHIIYSANEIINIIKNTKTITKYRKLSHGETITEHTYTRYERVGL